MIMDKAINITSENHVYTVALSNGRFNHLDLNILKELHGILNELSHNDDCRAIILSSKADCFCAGADFRSVEGQIDIASVKEFYSVAKNLFLCKKPIIAAINGAAIGAGLGLALVADFRVAGDGARFSANFTRLGIHPGFAVDFTLPRVVGRQNAAKLMYTSTRINAEQAYKIGLVDELAEDVMKSARDLAEDIAASAPNAVQTLHETLRIGLYEGVRKSLERSVSLQEPQFKMKDFVEGVTAMSQRRIPVFIGE